VALLLAMPDKSAVLPVSQIALGLSVEDEAAFLVRAVLRDTEPLASGQARRPIVVIGEGVFARRTGAALLAALREAGEAPVTLDFPANDAEGIAREVGKYEGATVFLALDPIDAVQVRTRLPANARLFATSQINAGGGGGAMTAIDLDGVRFVDLPWMIDAERGALAVFHRAPAAYSGDQQRLYALGIDAFRVANAWLRGAKSIELDGATGALRVDRDRSARAERKPAFAVFRDGRIQAIDNFKEEAPADSAACGQEKCPDELSATKSRDPNPAAAGR
jgi:outer membrane PBP1 activator LpoA protein